MLDKLTISYGLFTRGTGYLIMIRDRSQNFWWLHIKLGQTSGDLQIRIFYGRFKSCFFLD